MTLSTNKSASDYLNDLTTTLKAILPDLNPDLKESVIGALLKTLSFALSDLNEQLENSIDQRFTQTADSIYLDLIGADVGITRNPATQSNGNIVFTGTTIGAPIPLGTQATNSVGFLYKTTSGGVLSNESISINLTRNASLVTATVTTPHIFVDGQSITIAGADQADYNGAFVINYIDDFTFTYEINTTPATPATGTITASAIMVVLPALASNFGVEGNLDTGVLTLQGPISGVNDTVLLGTGGIGGGADTETDASYRARIAFRQQNYFGDTNAASVTALAQSVPGVTRVWIFGADTPYNLDLVSLVNYETDGYFFTIAETTSNHELGPVDQVTIKNASPNQYNGIYPVLRLDDTRFLYRTKVSNLLPPATGAYSATVTPFFGVGIKIYFVRDNDGVGLDILPNATEINDVVTAIEEKTTIFTSQQSFEVLAPTPLLVDITFSELTPNTPEMQDTISANLQDFFSNIDLQKNTVFLYQIENVIAQSVDVAGDFVDSFTLSAPAGDIVPARGVLPILGTVTYP